MKYTISGDNLQFVNIEFQPGEMIYSEAGSMVYMSGNVRLETRASGGVWKGVKRMAMGETLFMTNFYADGGTALVGFAGEAPGKIMAIDLRGGKNWIVQKTGFICAEQAVDLDIAFQKKLGAALFGGEGLILQSLRGDGTVFINGCGDFIEYILQPGQLMKVSTGHAVAWEESVSYDIQSLGIKSALFGGEGLFVTTFRGPGKIVLQSMTLAGLANSLVPFLPQRS